MLLLPLLLLGGALAKSSQFTPKDMLALPRPQGVVPAPDGSVGVEVVTQWDFEERKSHSSIYLISLNTSHPTPPTPLLNSTPTSSLSQPLFLTSSLLAYLNTTTHPSLYLLNLTAPSSPPVCLFTFPTAPEALKYLPPKKEGGEGVLAFSAHVWKGAGIEETGRLEEDYEERGDSGLVWDELYIRHFDTYRNPSKHHLLHLLPLPPTLAPFKPQFITPFNLSSQMDPFSTSDFSLSHSPTHPSRIQVVLQIKDPHLGEAFHTRRQVYHTSLVPTASAVVAPPPVMLTAGTQAAISALNISPDGKRVGWIENRRDGDEADRGRVVVVHLGEGGGGEGRRREEWTEGWDRSPSSLTWAEDSKSIYLLAENQGSILPYHLSHPGHLPTPLLFNCSTTSLHILPGQKLLLSKSSMTTPPESYILSHSSSSSSPGDGDKTPLPSPHQITHWASHGLAEKSLREPEKFWFRGWGGREIMGWVVKPRGWKEGERGRWPMAFLIHGGPEGAWEDAWSTRWNPELYAEQGYFTVAINPTGSTGYGDVLTQDIKSHWGDRPFKDLVAGLHYVLDLYPEVDRERLAALGASYGGYMINWMMGHNDQTNFKTFVCHDGVFDTFAMWYSTEEVYFPTAENGGLAPWEDRASYEKWSPVNFVGEWRTPALVIQGGQDFRVPESQAVGVFTSLQKRGIPSRFLYFPDENHWVLKPQNSLKWHREVFRWLEEWVGEEKVGPVEELGVGGGIERWRGQRVRG